MYLFRVKVGSTLVVAHRANVVSIDIARMTEAGVDVSDPVYRALAPMGDFQPYGS